MEWCGTERRKMNGVEWREMEWSGVKWNEGK